MQILICIMLLGVGHCCVTIGELPKKISNFAFKGVPTKSDTYVDGGGSLIDGKKERAVYDGSVSLTKRSGPEAWWMLTFDGHYLIDEIRLWNVKGSYASYLIGTSIYVDDVQVGIVRSIEKIPIILSLKNLYVIGSSIMIMGAGRPLLLGEVEVLGEKICSVNIAGEGTASQSNTNGFGFARLAIDGYIDGNYHRKSVTHTASAGKSAWWKLKFDEVRWICEIVIFNRMDCCQNWLNGATVFVGNVYFGRVKFVSGKQKYPFLNFKGAHSDTITIKGGDAYITLAEVEVFECKKSLPNL